MQKKLEGYRGDLAVIGLPYIHSEISSLKKLVPGIRRFLEQSAPIAIISGSIKDYSQIATLYAYALSDIGQVSAKSTYLLNPSNMEPYQQGRTIESITSLLSDGERGAVVFCPPHIINDLITNVPAVANFNRYPKITDFGGAVDSDGYLLQIKELGVCVPDLEQSYRKS